MTALRPRPFTLLCQRLARACAAACTALWLAACGGGNTDPAAQRGQRAQGAALGERIYQDRTLSGSGRMSCATCHDPQFAHGPPNAQAVQVGGQFETEFGLRAAPSIRYLERQPAFSTAPWHGGFNADGRADTLAAQARRPLLDAREMDNTSPELLARRLRGSAYAAQFSSLIGDGDATATFDLIQRALQAFQTEDVRFHPFDSKFDQVRAGRDQFSAAEARGQRAFADPARGNCAACHPDTAADGGPPLFTDFGYAALGVPRNADIPANADPTYFDLGLCGPLRSDLASNAAACGLFRTPGLRNVGAKSRFFHNGAMGSLAQVLAFYNTRDTEPARWYPVVGGRVDQFDDLPARYLGNLSKLAPLDGRAAGSTPAMSAQDLADIECFLLTLSDGHMAGSLPTPRCRD